MAMRRVARDVLTNVLGASKGESLLVVTDELRIEVGNAFYEAGDTLGLESSMFVLADSERPLEDVPADLARAVKGTAIVVNLFVAYPEETPFRVRLLSMLEGAGARVGHGPGITDDIMLKGAMRASFKELRDREVALRRRLAGAEVAELTGPGGTALRLGIAGREWVSDVVVRPGTYGNLPPGELWVAPVESRVKGKLVCDLLLHDTGRVRSPVTLEIARGRVVSVSSDDRDLVEGLEALLSVDGQARAVGELGVGINPAARTTGNMLEDTKRAGSVRLALGNNEDIPGGRNTSATHIDMLIRSPTLKVVRKGGRSRTVVDAGELVE